MNLPAIKADLLAKLQIEPGTTAPAAALADALTAINSAGQFLNMAGFPFWQLGCKTVSLDNATAEDTIDGARAVKKVMRLSNGLPLLRADSIGELKAFFATHSYPSSKMQPVPEHFALIYFCQQGDDPTKLDLLFGPTPLGEQEVVVTYAPLFDSYTVGDLDDAAKVPEVGAGYVENLFLPLARFYVSRSRFFNDAELKASIESDYGMAFNIVRSLNPALRLPTDEQVRRTYAPQKGGAA